MQAQGIGVMQASFYIAWSEEHENQGNNRKADLIYLEGFKKCAEPHDRLLQFHKYESIYCSFIFIVVLSVIFTIIYIVIHRALQARVSRQAMLNMEKDSSDEESKPPERVSLAVLKHRGKKKAIAPVIRTGTAIKGTT